MSAVSVNGSMMRANPLSVAGSNSKYKALGAYPAGFWAGLWYGMIAPITFVVSLFNTRVSLYETNNKGRFYDIGFFIGISGSVGGSGASTTDITPR